MRESQTISLVASAEWKRIILRAMDWCVALGLFWAFVGFEFGGSDDYSFLPWVYKMDDPALYPSDLRFSAEPSRYYYFHIALLYWAAKIFSVSYTFVVLNIVSVALLLYAMRRLVRSLWNVDVPVAGIALLMLAYGNAHLVGGYYLYSRSFSTHYPAIALTFVALSLTLERRYLSSGLATALALALNPRMGLASCLIVLAIVFMRRMRTGMSWTQSLSNLGLGGAVIIVIAVLYLRMTSLPGFDDIVRFWVYVRSPGHYLPSYWDGYVLPNLMLVAVYVALLHRTGLVTKAVIPLYAVLVGMLLAIAVGVINNQLLISTSLVLANPLQFGPVVLALIYVFMIGVLATKWRQYPFEVALVLILPTTQLRLLVLIVMMVIWSRKVDEDGPLGTGGPPRSYARGVLIQAMAVAISMAALPTEYHQVEPRYVLILLLPSLFALSVAAMVYRALGRVPERSLIVAAVVILAIAIFRGNVHGIRIDQGVESEWIEACAYVEQNTERGAMVVIPPEKYDFQARTKRSAYVSLIHIPLNMTEIPQWIHRLGTLRVFPPETKLSLLRTIVLPDIGRYETISSVELKKFANLAATPLYAIRRTQLSGESPIFSNEKYFVFKLI